MKKNIAHIITLTSLCIAILSIIESCNFNLTIGSFLILICFVLDSIDGTMARYLNSDSEFGKQLDSFSDMIAFGIAPGILMYNFLYLQFENTTLPYISLLIPIFSSLRLANYNIDINQKKDFLGLPTPVSAILFASIPLIYQYEKNSSILTIITNQWIISLLIVITSILLISQLKTLNLRLDAIKNDKRKLFFIFISICILSIFNFTGLPIVILIYILLSIHKSMNQ